jgi:hypothetical protein
MILVTERPRQTERDLNVALGMESLRDAEVGSSKTAIHVRRILPSEH